MHSPQSLRDDAGEGLASRMQAARMHLHAGRLADAEQIYRQILTQQPRHVAALHGLGVIAQQAGQPAAAIDLIRRAIAVDAGRSSFHQDLGAVLASVGRHDEAAVANRQAVAIDPESFGGWFGLGNACRASGNLERAVESWRRALAIRPQSWAVLSNLGEALAALGRFDEAVDAHGRALDLHPVSAEAHSRHGEALRGAGRGDDAMAAFRRATAIDPGFAPAHAHLAAALLEGGHGQEALESVRACLAAEPGNRHAMALEPFALEAAGERAAAAALLDFDAWLRERRWREAAQFASVTELNAALARHIESHPSVALAPPGGNLRGGRHTRELLTEPKGPASALEEMIRGAVGEYLREASAGAPHPFLARPPEHWRLELKGSLLDSGGEELPHIHAAAWLSGVYFVQLPHGISEHDQAGWIELGRPPESLDRGRATHVMAIRPREGLMLLFPSCVYQSTKPFTGAGTRIAIAFDVVPVAPGAFGTLPQAGVAVGTLLGQAEQWLASHALERAEEAAREALDLEPGHPQALYVLARAAFEKANMPVAADYLRRAIHASPDAAQYHIDYATCLRVLQRHAEAAAEMERGFALGADYALAWQTMGGIMADLGRKADAEAAFRTAIARKPALGSAWYGLAQVKRFRKDDPDLAAMQDTLARDDLADNERANLHTALGRAREDLGEYDEAFEHFRSGNDIKRRPKPFDAESELDNARRIVRSFTPEIFAAAGEPGDPSELPVFVVGMPRSGTTLVEQILDSHPQVFGAGEINHLWRTVTQIGMYLPRNAHLPEAIGQVRPEAWPRLAEIYLEGIRRHAPGAERIVDKLPFNYTLLGVARLMLPRARIIHCLRDPLDTCVSCFTTSFANDRGFTNTLEDLGMTYRAYRDIMRHWEAVLPGGMLEVRYEALIDDTEAAARRMVRYLGLEWSDACLDFHRNPRAVVTASHAQVRQPVYRTSVGRWRRYERHLGPLREALGDAADGKAGT